MDREAMAHRVAAEWLNGYKPSSLKGNRKRLLEADVDLAKQFRDLVLDCLVSNVLEVDPDNPGLGTTVGVRNCSRKPT